MILPQLPALADSLKTLVLRTGAFMREEFHDFDKEVVEMKRGHKDLVSYVDKTAEKMLMEGCLELTPDCGFIMEETGEQDKDNNLRWIIDPLDGTTNFVHGIPLYTISIALQQNENTVLGAVYDVERDEYFEAALGAGAKLNGRTMHVSGAETLSKSVIATGFPYALSDIANDYLAVLSQFVLEGQGVRRLGSAALDLAWVAAGRFDGFYEIRLNPWDVAAGALIVKEAGGQVSDFLGTANYIFGRQIVASNAHIHEAMREIIVPRLCR